MEIDENKAYLTDPDGRQFQVLDEHGNFDSEATAAEYAEAND